jgi:hypothetical protein
MFQTIGEKNLIGRGRIGALLWTFFHENKTAAECPSFCGCGQNL